MAEEKRDNGTGCVVQLRHSDKKTDEIVKSRYYYILYRVGGRRIRESSGSESKQVAEQLLQRRLGEAGLGLKPHQDVKNLKYEEVRDAYLAEAKNKGLSFCQKKDGTEYFNGVQHLDAFFAGMQLLTSTPICCGSSSKPAVRKAQQTRRFAATSRYSAPC